MRKVAVTLLPLALLALAACGTDGAPDATEPSDVDVEVTDLEIEVVVDVMSGVPNPSWTVTGDEARELVAMIDDLPEDGTSDGPDDQALGFRGFVLRGVALDGHDQVRVLGTEIIASDGDDVGPVLVDDGHAAYTVLRTMSEEHLDENVMQAIPTDGLKGSS